MPSASWLNGWLTGDIVTSTEQSNGMGAFFDSTAGGAVASFDITSVPTWGSHLKIVLYGRGDTAATSIDVNMRFNNDATSIYASQRLQGNNVTATAAETNSVAQMRIGTIAAASATAGFPGSVEILVPFFRNVSLYKNVRSTWGYDTALTTGAHFAGTDNGVWQSVGITRVTLFPSAGNFVTGSRCTAYVMGP